MLGSCHIPYFRLGDIQFRIRSATSGFHFTHLLFYSLSLPRLNSFPYLIYSYLVPLDDSPLPDIPPRTILFRFRNVLSPLYSVPLNSITSVIVILYDSLLVYFLVCLVFLILLLFPFVWNMFPSQPLSFIVVPETYLSSYDFLCIL